MEPKSFERQELSKDRIRGERLVNFKDVVDPETKAKVINGSSGEK